MIKLVSATFLTLLISSNAYAWWDGWFKPGAGTSKKSMEKSISNDAVTGNKVRKKRDIGETEKNSQQRELEGVDVRSTRWDPARENKMKSGRPQKP